MSQLRSYTTSEHPGDVKELCFVVSGTLQRKIKLVDKLGEGRIGNIFLAEDITLPEQRSQLAIKIIERGDLLLIQEAVELIRDFGHCGKIAEIYEDYFAPKRNEFDQDRLYIILVYSYLIYLHVEIL